MGKYSAGPSAVSVQRELTALCREVYAQHAGHRTHFDTRRPSGFELRERYDPDGHTRRLVAYLRGTQCEWNSRAGGCSYCGFYLATNGDQRVSAESFSAQLEHVAEEYLRSGANALGLYNDGSFFNDREIEPQAQVEIIRRVARWPGIRKITLESRPEYLKPGRLQAALDAAQGVPLEIAAGLDSTDQNVIKLCTNRGVNVQSCLRTLDQLRDMGIQPTVLLVFKLPFHSERQAVEEAERSIRELLSRGISIDLEAMTLQRGSLVHLLHSQGLYTPPWIWSLVELFRRLPDTRQVYLSPFSYSVATEVTPCNCHKCTQPVLQQLFEVFPRTHEKTDLPQLLSCCADLWRAQMEDSDSMDIVSRARQALAQTRRAIYNGMARQPLEVSSGI